jgi:hypothetical protein
MGPTVKGIIKLRARNAVLVFILNVGRWKEVQNENGSKRETP